MRNNTFFSKRLPVWPVFLGLLLLTNILRANQEPALAKNEAIKADSYAYALPSDSASLYRDASWLPDTNKKDCSDLATTIQTYAQQSLTRSNQDNTKASLTIAQEGTPTITLNGSELLGCNASLFNARYAKQGPNGVANCQKTAGCRDTDTAQQYPWAVFLPLGMAMTKQALVNFMKYPPTVSPEQKDYLGNNTMKRRLGALQAIGIQRPVLYEAIVDGRPVAAAGSKIKMPLPDSPPILTCQAITTSPR